MFVLVREWGKECSTCEKRCLASIWDSCPCKPIWDEGWKAWAIRVDLSKAGRTTQGVYRNDHGVRATVWSSQTQNVVGTRILPYFVTKSSML